MSDAVDQIKERLSILDVIRPYVELVKAGKNYKGKSPFTSEKTPSFYVSPDRGMYYCFSSSQGGDIFTFVEKMEGVDFKGALKILADKAGVELVPEDPKKRDARQAQYDLLETAAAFFFKNREGDEEKTKYVEKRGVTGKSMHLWRIGYAKDEWRSLKEYLESKKYTESQMLKAGLIKTGDGKESYDVFRDRIMFPIFDSSGRVVAFSGRTLKKDDETPKYVNSPETELFQKSEILYGYDKAKQGIRQYDFSLIVEGQFDVVLAHQAGYTNAVAVSGTALTPHHVRLLERLSSRAVLALDADRAGIASAKRSSALMLKGGMDVKVTELPEGKDPADIIQNEPKDFKKLIGSSVHIVEFLLKLLKKQAKDARTYKLQTREEVLPLIAVIPNKIDREHFAGVAAEAVDATKESIIYELERILEKMDKEEIGAVPEAPTPPPEKPKRSDTRKNELTKYLIAFSLVADEKCSDTQKKAGKLLAGMCEKKMLDSISEEFQSEISKTTFEIESILADLDAKQVTADIEDKLTELSQIIAREKMAALREKIGEAEKTGEEDAVRTLLEETKAIEKQLQQKVEL